MYREAKIRVTNLLFIFWDVLYPLGYLLVFGVGIDRAAALHARRRGCDYNAFFLAGVLGMASFGIASNTAWSFFHGSRQRHLLRDAHVSDEPRRSICSARCCSTWSWRSCRRLVTVVLAAVVLGVPIVVAPAAALVAAVVIVGTAGWFFFYAIFACSIRRNDAFNTVTSIFYFVFLFASSMFYPLEPLPCAFQVVAYANPSPGRSTCCGTRRSASAIRAGCVLEAAGFRALHRRHVCGALAALRRES